MPAPSLAKYLVPPNTVGHAAGSGAVSAQPPGAPSLRKYLEPPAAAGTAGFAAGGSGPIVAPKERGFADELSMGFSSNIDSLQMSAYGLAALTGREFGSTDLEEWGMQGAVRNLDESTAANSASRATDLAEVEDAGGFFRWLANRFGGAIPSLALAATGSGIGGVLGRKVAETAIRKTITQQITKRLTAKGFSAEASAMSAKRLLATSSGEKMLANAVIKGKTAKEITRAAFLKGGALGGSAAAAGPMTGAADLELTEAGFDSGMTSLMVGVVGGALEAIPALRLIDKLFPGVDKIVAKAFIKDFLIASGSQHLIEGGTELAQEAIQLAAMAYHDPTFDMFSAENKGRMIEAYAVGAMVGTITGGAAQVLGQKGLPSIRARLARAKAKKLTMPTWSLSTKEDGTAETKEDKYPEGFEPADNTVYEELRDRVINTVAPVVDPVVNKLRDGAQKVLDVLDSDMGGGMNSAATKLSKIIVDAHNKFVDTHKQEFARLKSFVNERSASLYAAAQNISDPVARQAFIDQGVETIRKQVQPVVDAIKDRAKQRDSNTEAEVDNMDLSGILDELTAETGTDQDDAGSARQQDPETLDVDNTFEPAPSFTLGKFQKEPELQPDGTETVVGYDTREQAEQALEQTVRPEFPAAQPETNEQGDLFFETAEDPFIINEQADGTFVIEGDMKVLGNDVQFNRALKRARASARRTKNTVANKARKTADGKIDMITLAHAGKDAGAKTTREGLLTMAAEMVLRGKMTNEESKAMIEKFDKLKEHRDPQIRLDLVAPEPEYGSYAQAKRARAMLVKEVQALLGNDNKAIWNIIGIRKTKDGKFIVGIDDKQAFYYLQRTKPNEALILFNKLRDDRRQRALANEQGNRDPDTFGPGRGDTEVVTTQVPDRSGGVGPVSQPTVLPAEDTTTRLEQTPGFEGGQRDFAGEEASFPSGDQRRTQNVKVVEETDPDRIDPKKSEPGVETEEEQRLESQSRKYKTDKEKKDAAKIHRDEREAKHSEGLKLTRKIMGRKGILSVMISDRIDPDGSTAKAVKSIVGFVQKTLGMGNPVVVIDDTGLANLIETGLVNDPIFQETLDDKNVDARNIRLNDVSYIYLSDKILGDPSLTTTALAHELGHQLYRTVWTQLTSNAKLRMYNAFRKSQGKRPLKKFPTTKPKFTFKKMTDKQLADAKKRLAKMKEKQSKLGQTNQSRALNDDINMAEVNIAENEFARREVAEDEAILKDPEFNEWMADQLAAWTVSRKGPRNQVEAFFHDVGSKIRRLYDFVAGNKRFKLNETFAEFTDALHARAANAASPNANPLVDELLQKWFTNEGMTGYTFWPDISVDNMEVPPTPRLAVQRYNKLMKQFADKYPAIAKRAKTTQIWLQKAYDLVASPATSVMRRIGETVPIANELVAIFGRGEMGVKKAASNFHQRSRRFKGQFLEVTYKKILLAIDKQVANEIKTGTKVFNTTKEEQAYIQKRTQQIKQKLVKSLRSKEGVANKDATFTKHEQAVRDLFDEMHEYAVDNGLPVRHIVNYFPKKYSRQLWVDNKQRILDHLMDPGNGQKGMTLKQARIHYDAITDPSAKDGRATVDGVRTPAFDAMNSRTQNDPFFDEFLDDNIDGIVSDYVGALVDRVEFNRVLGEDAPADVNFTQEQLIKKGLWDPKKKWNAMLAQAKKEGATDEQLKQMEAYVEVNLGTYGKGHDLASPGARKVMANMIAYQNMRVLLYTVFASLPDAGGIIVRAGVKNGAMGIAFKAMKNHIREAGKTESGLADMARALGEISSVMNDHIMTEFTDNNFMSPAMRKANDAYFKYTGLNWYTDFTRKLSLAVGIDVILHQAEMAVPGRTTEKGMFEAQAMLAELGITEAMVTEWNESGRPVYGSIGYDEKNPAHSKVAEALNQWVSESIMRPDASQRPILSSHPAMQLVYHLKTFTYSIQNTVLRRIAFNYNEANGVNETAQALVVPVVMMMALTAIGLELRELVKYFGSNRQPPTDRMDGMEYVTELWTRAGLNGVTQLAWDFEDAESKGRNAFAGASGPTFSQLAEFYSKPMTQTLPKTLPVVGQLQGGRDLVRKGISPTARKRRKAAKIREDMASGEKIPYLIMGDGIATSVTYGDKKFQKMYEGMTSPLKDGGGFMRVRPTHPLVRRDLKEDPDDLKFREKIKFSVADDIENRTITIAPNNSVAAQ